MAGVAVPVVQVLNNEESNPDARSSDSEEDSETECYGTRIYRLDAAERQELRDRGVVVREGAWTGLEDEQLKKNMRHICQKYGIDDPRKLIFADDYPDGKEIRKLFEDELIHMKLRKGIQRPVYNVYIRARKIFDPSNYLGRFTNEEVHTMKKLARKMGTRWSQIGRKMGRSGRALCDRFKISGNGMNSGFWSDEERERLVRVVKELSGFNQDQDVEKLYFNISWVKVKEAMETRNVHQCRQEWIHIVSWVAADYQTRYTSRGRWNIEDNIRLIERIYNMDIHDEQDIDWMALLDHFPRIPSPQKLCYHWYRLKVKYLPNYRFKIFEDIVCHLHDTALPELREKLTQHGQRIVSREIVEAESDSEPDDAQDVNERINRVDAAVTMTTGRGIANASHTGGGRRQEQDGERTEEGRLNEPDEVEREERIGSDRNKKKKRKKRPRNEDGATDQDCEVNGNVRNGPKDAENGEADHRPKKMRVEVTEEDERRLDEEERTSFERKKKKKKKKNRVSDSEIPG